MEREAWLAVKEPTRDAMLKTIGLAATCAGDPQLEQNVMIRDGSGVVIEQQTVQTSFGNSDALEG